VTGDQHWIERRREIAMKKSQLLLKAALKKLMGQNLSTAAGRGKPHSW
jgi:hypothetical protein